MQGFGQEAFTREITMDVISQAALGRCAARHRPRSDLWLATSTRAERIAPIAYSVRHSGGLSARIRRPKGTPPSITKSDSSHRSGPARQVRIAWTATPCTSCVRVVVFLVQCGILDLEISVTYRFCVAYAYRSSNPCRGAKFANPVLRRLSPFLFLLLSRFECRRIQTV